MLIFVCCMTVFIRKKVFEDVQRILNIDDIINKVVFDLEDNR